MSKETSRILEEIVELTYFMRGSVQYHALLHMSIPERTAVNDFLNKRLEAEFKKTSNIIY